MEEGYYFKIYLVNWFFTSISGAGFAETLHYCGVSNKGRGVTNDGQKER